ncbi:MAG: hypothetical protein ACLQJR_18040 [Stellaceae bacterium]
MKAGDRVDIHYSDGKVEAAEIVSVDQGIVTLRVVPRAGTVMVPVDRLVSQGQDRWRLDF